LAFFSTPAQAVLRGMAASIQKVPLPIRMLVILPWVAAGARDLGPDVTTITNKTFVRVIDRRDKNSVWFVLFYGPDCHECELFYPEMKRAARKGAGLVRFGAVDTGEERELSDRFRIRGIPWFYIWYRGGYLQYTGARHHRAILEATARRIPSLAADADPSWLTEPGLRAAVLLAKKRGVPPVWAALSCNLSKSDIRVGISADPDTFSAFGVTSVPTIVVLNGGNRTYYTGEIAFADIRRALADAFPDIARTTVATRLTGISEFDENCRGKGIYCVIQGADQPTQEFDDVAAKNQDAAFMFFACGKKCPMKYPTNGFWIFDHAGEQAVKVDTIQEIEEALAKVARGNGEFKPIDEIIRGNDL
jgi:thiol-disulfide isomerase/thioredoxin